MEWPVIDWTLGYAVLAFVTFLVMLFVVPRHRTPSSAVAWLLFVALVPILGLLSYVLFGTEKLPRRRRRMQERMDAILRERVEAARADPPARALVSPPLPGRFARVASLAERLGGLPAVAGNTVDLIDGYDESIREIARAIASAKAYVHLEYFILAMDDTTEPLFQALEASAVRGVKVRVLFDHLGSLRYRHYRKMLKRMTKAGIDWQRSLPVLPFDGQWARPDLRNHRKIVVIDGILAYMGSQNMIARDYHAPPLRFEEAVARVRGPAARAFDAIFVADWHAETQEILADEDDATLASMDVSGPALCQVVPSGPAYRHSNNLRVFVSLIYAARRRLVLVNPYFVPNEALLVALASAAQRGIDVRLITHEKGDSRFFSYAQRSYYDELLVAGVKIYLRPHPIVLHSKTMTVDDDLCVVGSSNFDTRSLFLHHEVSMVTHDPAFVAAVHATEARHQAESRALDLATWRRRPRRTRSLENLARLAAGLL